VYQIGGGYEDANDSNHLRYDPVYKIACGRLPKTWEHLLASQPTITRLENQVTRRDIERMRGKHRPIYQVPSKDPRAMTTVFIPWLLWSSDVLSGADQPGN